MGERREGHRRALVTAFGGEWCIHRQASDKCDNLRVGLG
jgi:hypothetical protein